MRSSWYLYVQLVISLFNVVVRNAKISWLMTTIIKYYYTIYGTTILSDSFVNQTHSSGGAYQFKIISAPEK